MNIKLIIDEHLFVYNFFIGGGNFLTLENFNYRTSPLFLRNSFDSNEPWSMPVVPKSEFNLTSSSDLRLIGFNKVRSGKDTHFKRMVHFFLYDYEFECIWENPEKYVDILKQYEAVLTPDFSMYIEMNPIMQLYNTFRNRWIGAFLREKGIKVIPTVNWGLDNTFDFCFNGIEKGSIVAVSTYMVSAHGNYEDQKEFFMKGYNEMLRRIEPELIICYHKPFPEMDGNILYIDYNLSSWRHFDDDECKSIKSSVPTPIIKYFRGYVCADVDKGSGSAFGGRWRPKKDADERFVGKPGEIKETIKENGDIYATKIGDDGRAVLERHYTTHNREHTGHTNPHDHKVDWSNGCPRLKEPINYPDLGSIPEFKHYKRSDNMTTYYLNPDDLKFEDLSDFKHSLVYGGEIEFEWQGTKYGAFREGEGDKSFYLCEAYKDAPGEGFFFRTPDDMLDFEIDGRPLRDFITEVTVHWRGV